MTKNRSPRRRRGTRPPRSPWQLFLLLVPLVLLVVLFGHLAYGWMLAIGSAIFVGFFGWLAWSRRPTKPTPSRRRR